MTREHKIAQGKIWHVYPDANPDDIQFEGSKTACLTFIRVKGWQSQFRRGTVKIGKLLWENLQPSEN